MKPKRRYPGIVGYLEDKMKELRELCDSRDEEWVRNEMQRREDASRKRHEENVAKMEKFWSDRSSDIDPETGKPWIWLRHKTVKQEEKNNG